jgi:hypothetical protein
LLKDVNIEDALEDSAYYTNDAFEFMKSYGADCPGIKIRGNVVVGKEESSRSMAVLEYQQSGIQKLEANASVWETVGS